MAAAVLPWLQYRWNFDFPVGMYAAILARLRGTPARLEELLTGAAAEAARRPSATGWSAQEHAGHLVSVERLWQTRLAEFARGATELTAADMANRATEGADYNATALADVLAGFRAKRATTMALLGPQGLDAAARTAHHPRLDRQIRLVDLCFFAAEHDDHHLAAIHALETSLKDPFVAYRV
jgi:uncharacterized damage-inducible protein DinB